jgi:type IV pilus assembly protein PilZ
VTGSDRRRFPRYATRIEVDWASGETFLFAYITDISALGIFVQTEEPAPKGRRIRLRFGAPSDARAAEHYPDLPFELTGEVVWCSGDGDDDDRRGMGVQLVDLDDAKRDRVLQLVQAVAYLDDPRGD